MHTLVASQTLSINSSECPTGSPGDFSVALPANAVSCTDGQVFMVSLKRFCTFAGWSWIPEGSAFTIEVNELPYTLTLPPGNPTLKVIAQSITSQVSAPKFLCSYERNSQKLVFACAPSSEIQLIFSNPAVGKYLGFDSAVAPTLGLIKSQRAIQPIALSAIRVHMYGMQSFMNSGNWHNTRQELMQPSRCLATIPADVEPYTRMDVVLDSTFKMPVVDKDITELRFHITDTHSADIPELTEVELQVQIDTYQTMDPSLAPLTATASSIRTLELMALAGQAESHPSGQREQVVG